MLYHYQESVYYTVSYNLLAQNFPFSLPRPKGIPVLDDWDTYIISNINMTIQKLCYISDETQKKRQIPLLFVHLCVQLCAEQNYTIVKKSD